MLSNLCLLWRLCVFREHHFELSFYTLWSGMAALVVALLSFSFELYRCFSLHSCTARICAADLKRPKPPLLWLAEQSICNRWLQMQPLLDPCPNVPVTFVQQGMACHTVISDIDQQITGASFKYFQLFSSAFAIFSAISRKGVSQSLSRDWSGHPGTVQIPLPQSSEWWYLPTSALHNPLSSTCPWSQSQVHGTLMGSPLALLCYRIFPELPGSWTCRPRNH